MMNLAIDWKRVVDCLHKGVVVIDSDGAIRHCNPAFEVLTGYRAEELLGNPCTILKCSGCDPWHGDVGFRCALFSSGQSIKPMVCRIIHKCGNPLKVIRHAAILHDGKGIPVGAVETMWEAEYLNNSDTEKVILQQIPLHPFPASH